MTTIYLNEDNISTIVDGIEEQEDRAELKRKLIDRGVRLLHEQDTLKEDMKELVEEADAKGFDKTEIKALIKHTYKNQITEEIEKLEAIRSELSNLYGD